MDRRLFTFMSFLGVGILAFLQAQPVEEPKQRVLLITGCARSGTTYIAKFLQMNGLEIGHEKDGTFGIVSWPMAVDADMTPWGPGANSFSFTHTFHQVRHPLKTIASAGNEPLISWEYICRFVPEIDPAEPKIIKGAKYWYYWNKLAEKKAEWTYQIENLESTLEEMERRLGTHLFKEALSVLPKDVNTRHYSDHYTWQDLKEALPEDLYHNITAMAIRYGYAVDE